MKPEYAPNRRPSNSSVAALAAISVFAAFAAALLFLAAPAGAEEGDPRDRGDARRPSPLAGMEAEFKEGPDGLLVEIPEGCRLAAYDGGEGGIFSLTVEAADGTRTEVSGGEARASVMDGRLAIVGESGDSAERSEAAEVVGAEGFVCLDNPDEAGERVLSEVSRTAEADETGEEEESSRSEEEGTSRPQAEDESSAGQQTDPLSDEATINRADTADGESDPDGDIESIEISADGCETGEEAEVADGAAITLSETETEEELVFTDGEDGVDIASDGSTVTITPASAADGLGGEEAAVESQTGISCGAVDDDNDGDDDAATTSTTSAPESAGNLSCASGQTLTDIAAFSRATEEADDVETMRTEEFTTTGESFRVRYSITSTGTDRDVAEFRASVLGGDGAATESFAADLEDSTSDSGVLVADLPAGAYRIRVVAQNVQYDITVAECRAGSTDADDADTDADDTDTSDTDSSRNNVIPDTVPDKTLANTGGPSLGIMAAGLSFVVVGAMLVWFVARRGRDA